MRPQRLRKPTLVAISRAIEEEAIARAAGPVVIAAFQAERNYRAVEHRYRRLAHVADAVGVFAASTSADRLRRRARRDPDRPADALGHEWAVIVDAPGYAACLVGWETPDRAAAVFEAVWTMDPTVVRRAAQVGAALAARTAPAWSERLLGLLADRPLAVEQPAPGLTALTNRMISYLDAGERSVADSTAGIRSTARLSALPPSDEADLGQLAGRADRGRDEFGALRRAERLRRRRVRRAACACSGGEAGRTARSGAAWRRASAPPACASARAPRGAPSRSGRVAGSVPSTRGCAGFAFPSEPSPPSLGVYAWNRRRAPLIIVSMKTFPPRSAQRCACRI